MNSNVRASPLAWVPPKGSTIPNLGIIEALWISPHCTHCTQIQWIDMFLLRTFKLGLGFLIYDPFLYAISCCYTKFVSLIGTRFHFEIAIRD